jgi:hypothetical protein
MRCLPKKQGVMKLKKRKFEVSGFSEKEFLQKRRTDKLCLYGADEKNKLNSMLGGKDQNSKELRRH